jgi:hypothetical protein
VQGRLAEERLPATPKRRIRLTDTGKASGPRKIWGFQFTGTLGAVLRIKCSSLIRPLRSTFGPVCTYDNEEDNEAPLRPEYRQLTSRPHVNLPVNHCRDCKRIEL